MLVPDVILGFEDRTVNERKALVFTEHSGVPQKAESTRSFQEDHGKEIQNRYPDVTTDYPSTKPSGRLKLLVL